MSSEKRARVLTPDDITAIGEAFDERVIRLLESIGYDVTTPASRASIREDHTFLRDFRVGSGKVKLGALTSLAGAALVGMGVLLWHTVSASTPKERPTMSLGSPSGFDRGQ